MAEDSSDAEMDIIMGGAVAAAALLLDDAKKKKQRRKPRCCVREGPKAREQEGYYYKLLPQLRKDREWCFK